MPENQPAQAADPHADQLVAAAKQIRLTLLSEHPCNLRVQQKHTGKWSAWIPNISTHGDGDTQKEAVFDLASGLREYASNWIARLFTKADQKPFRDFVWLIMLSTDAEVIEWLNTVE